MLTILIFTFVVLYLFNEFYWKRRGLPPGPTPLPIIGNMLEMFSYPPPGTAAFAAWSEKFGKIYTIWLGTGPAVVVTGYKELKETFVNDGESYMDKFILEKFNTSFRGGEHGVIDTNGNTWKEHRKFALHTLKDFGMGKEAMEASIQLENDNIEKELRKMEGKEVNVQEQYDMAIGNIINQFLFGIRFNDPAKFNEIKKYLDDFFHIQGSMRLYLSYTISWLPQWMVELLTYDVARTREGIYGFLEQQIKEHREEIDFDSEDSKDYVETYMKEQKKRESEGDFVSFSNDQLRNMCFDMWAAGMHTTSNTMGFLTAFAINNMDAQRKMQKELSEVVGDRMVTMKDKLNLPYTNAFINETQRVANLVPINLPHATTRDVILAGHTVPKGTTVIHQISSVLSDPEIFPEPEKFDPERFIDEAGNLKKCEELVPFSIGKRICLGEGLARMELFLFTANLFNRFEFLAGANGVPSLERTYSSVAKVKDFTCSVKASRTHFYWKRRGLPPGPTPLPIIGNMIEMFSYPPPGTAAYSAWTQKFGKIYTIWMGTDPAVIITGYQELKETFIHDADSYSDKMIFDKFNVSLRGGDYGVIDTNGNTWKEHRKFALHTLKDFGMGKEKMEASIQMEVDSIEEELRKSEGKEVNVQEQYDMAIGNIINQFLFGIRFNDPAKFNELKKLLDLFFEVQGSLRVYFAYTVNFLPQWAVELMTPDVGRVRDGIFNFFQEQIDEHRKEIDFDSEDSKDYVETYMKEQKKRESEGDYVSFSNDQLRNMCFDMWVAGMHTTTNTMGFLTAFAINNMEAQQKMQKELSEVVGDRMVTMKDKLNLPYTNAFINESQRLANLLPMNLPHATTRDVVLAGHTVPKGTTVIHQISSVLSDPEIFPEPEKFVPERFIDEAGNLKKCEELVPFSIGKRICLGEGLARMELFLFTANLFNRFEFLAGANGAPSLERTYAFIAKAKDFTCKVRARYSN